MAKKTKSNTVKRNWIENVCMKRNAMASTVALCQTTDEERIKEFTTYVMNCDVVNEPENKTQTVYEVDFHAGVSRVYKNGKHIEREKVALEMSTSFDPTEPMLRFIEQEASSKRIVVIIKGFIRQNTLLEDFINSVSFSDVWFGTESTAVVFIPDQNQIMPVVRQRTAPVDIPLSTEDERMAKLLRLSETYDIPVSDEGANQIVQTLSGMNLTNVESALIESVLQERDFVIPYLARVKSEAIQKETSLEVFVNGSKGFESIGGYEYMKRLFRDSIISFLRETERAEAMGIKPVRGILLYGMGGTGKTLIGKALANELGIPFIGMSASDFLTSGIVSESEQNLKRSIQTINEIGRCVLFIDELDSMAGQRGQSGEMDGGTTKRLFGMLLSWLGDENRECIVIATTNRPEDIDKAMKRSGRFDIVVPMLLPDAVGRREILKVHTEVKRTAPNTLSESEWAQVVAGTEYWTGADIEVLVLNAQRIAFKEGLDKASFKHYKKALENEKKDVEGNKKEQERMLNLNVCTSNEFLEEARMSFQTTSMSRADRVKSKIQGE